MPSTEVARPFTGPSPVSSPLPSSLPVDATQRSSRDLSFARVHRDFARLLRVLELNVVARASASEVPTICFQSRNDITGLAAARGPIHPNFSYPTEHDSPVPRQGAGCGPNSGGAGSIVGRTCDGTGDDGVKALVRAIAQTYTTAAGVQAHPQPTIETLTKRFGPGPAHACPADCGGGLVEPVWSGGGMHWSLHCYRMRRRVGSSRSIPERGATPPEPLPPCRVGRLLPFMHINLDAVRR